MSSDRTRISYDKDRQYRSVVAQQGRVTLESDWNESQVIVSEEARAEALDFVGSNGTPDNGYEIAASNPNAPFDFSIGKGTMYVGGIRTLLDRDIKYSEQNEKLDWLDRDPNSFPAWVDSTTLANPDFKNEFIYLYLQEQEISAVKDTALKEIALGGPDTTQRTRLIQKIVRLGVQANDCGTALNIAKGAWAKQGLIFNDRTMRLESNTKLKVSFQPPDNPPDLCEPEARGGYLEAENQLIRVKISATGKLIWGYDNVSFLYRTKWIDNHTLELQSRPVDEKHQPKKDKFVEVLRSIQGTTISTTSPVSCPFEYLGCFKYDRQLADFLSKKISRLQNTINLVVHEVVEHHDPQEILASLAKLEVEIQQGMKDLEFLLK